MLGENQLTAFVKTRCLAMLKHLSGPVEAEDTEGDIRMRKRPS